MKKLGELDLVYHKKSVIKNNWLIAWTIMLILHEGYENDNKS